MTELETLESLERELLANVDATKKRYDEAAKRWHEIYDKIQRIRIEREIRAKLDLTTH